MNFNETEKKIINFLLDNPYTEKKLIIEAVGDPVGIDEELDKLTDSYVLIELTGPMESSLESRVSKKIYMVNPEKEEDIKCLL